MRTLPWQRQELIAQIRQDIWRYLTPAASIEHELLEAAALLQLSVVELRTLGRLEFLISDEVGALLQEMPFLLRRLATTTAKEEEWSAERVRGAIQWGRTIGVRQATGIPHMYVTAPARRAFQTSENELLVLLLDAIVRHGHQLGWQRSSSEGIGKLISGRVNQAERWRQFRALLEVERRPMTAMKIARIRSGRHRRRYATALAAYERYRLLAEKLDRASIRAAVESFGIVSRDDATLFELICTFRTLEALQRRGWHLQDWGCSRVLSASGGGGETRPSMSHTRRLRLALRTRSEYRQVQMAHRINPGGLRPDLVIRVQNTCRAPMARDRG